MQRVASTTPDSLFTHFFLPLRQVASTTQAFAVLASDGSIHTWGDANFGGTTVAVDPLPKAVALYSTQVTQGYTACRA